MPVLGPGVVLGKLSPRYSTLTGEGDPGHTAALSSFVQTGGFHIAATGPMLLVSLHAGFDSWTDPLVILAIACVLNFALSWRAGNSQKPQRVLQHSASE